MEGPGSGEALPPDLRELESKVGRRAPEGLVRWLREDPAAALLGESPARGQRRGLAGKIKALKLELAYLRAIDVQILQQLVVVNEGIEAVKWLLEEKGTLTSRCSSLASSQYSLVESQETSRRGSWTSLQDPSEKLDSISVGSYLDTLADELDEYSHGAMEPGLSSTPDRGLPSKPGSPQDQEWLRMDHSSARKGSPARRNGQVDFEHRKLNSKLPLAYDAHWRWVQSQDDVTFL
uniref:Leucine rich adaptor protein 1 n=1 Tax=Chelydra serpentina TaxID=8475 RepID=A0A8C3SBC3_CHESE